MNENPSPEQLHGAKPQPADQVAPKKRAGAKPANTKSARARPAKRTCIMVLGMHRSGTSALTRAISLLGAALPKQVIAPDENNANGYWEPTSLNMLNEKMLTEAGSSWDDWRSFDLGGLSNTRKQFFKNEVARIVEAEYGDESLIVLKEPRISRFVPLYEEILGSMNFQMRYVLTVRNPLSVIASLKKRDGLTPAYASLLWLRYVLDSEWATRGATRAFLSYESLVTDWYPAIARVDETLSIDWPKPLTEARVEIDRFLSARHQHHTATTELLLGNDEIADWAKDTYLAVRSLEKDANDERTLIGLGQIKTSFDAGSRQFGAACVLELHARRATFSDRIKTLIDQNVSVQAEADALAAQKNAQSKLLAQKDKQILELVESGDAVKARLGQRQLADLEIAASLEREAILKRRENITVKNENLIAGSKEDSRKTKEEVEDNRRKVEELSQKSVYIAFYLPQFYPFPENDAWWGKGFTEWTNVTKAAPLFEGHYQPQLPTELGFYDLRVRETQHEQIALAQQYGVDAFCFHYYWFNDGKRLLDKPVDAYLADKTARMPFCLSWANENWTRRWDGAEQQLLISQDYQPGYEAGFIESIAPFLRDDRYLRVEGRPIVLVYRPQQLPQPAQAVAKWREHCRKIGIGEIHLVAALTHGNLDYEGLGFDAGVEFPPHNMMVENISHEVTPFQPLGGMFVNYADVAGDFLRRDYRNKKVYRTVVPSWDNTARLGSRAVAMLGATPDNYERWLRAATSRTIAERAATERLVFINAWNEWAEGCHLEPDRKFGRAFLDATLRVKESRSVLDDVFDPHPFRSSVDENNSVAVSSSAIWVEDVPSQRFAAIKLKTQSLLSHAPVAYKIARFGFRAARAFARPTRSMWRQLSASQRVLAASATGRQHTLPMALETVSLGRSAREVQSRTELLAARNDAILTAYPGRAVTGKRVEVTAGKDATKRKRLSDLFAEKHFDAVPLQFGRFLNCVAHARAIGVITQGGALVEESIRVYRYVYRDLNLLDYLDEADEKYILLSNKFKFIDEDVILPLHSSFAFGHVIFDVVPQILFWEKEIKEGRLKVVLPNDAPLWVSGILATWGYLPHHFLILPHTPYRFRSAIVCNGLTTNTTYYPNPDALAQYATLPALPCASKAPALIYLARDRANTYSNRVIDNEAEVISTLENLGFTAIDPSKLPYVEQMGLFRSAKIIVGAHGSAFANVVWCQPGTKLIDVMPDDWVGYWNDYGITEMWLSRTSAVFSLDYEVLLCRSQMVESPFPGQPHLTQREVTSQVDTGALRQRVRALLKVINL
ncbi:MAG: DUF563 domain-containing protein [Mesorhizobium sp.]|uniref:glycoside hydrolase family 99-like domain-containing protein n=2 Tax=Mesorhizobium TaxID=68287 RepID=UPI000BAF303B|nr:MULTISPECIES: glycoside hydrolase family 99-like domain-containing protein [unclassified Mesorhizobium]PBB35022.1 hypothetical protein CK214_04990 [Mesorhizobium sp. WSM3882]RUV06875.1 DUF563 domain-containing protein [Mesorhizobium sp. M1A.F.Ca.IN.020.03.2.1]RUV84369.1 DUF563 domain-containing protein [Mesorhizobium sp. M1A.F.Ca.IN.020.32.1.1]RUW10060.1 DUF563 domain-containing protein [Mesorhizobium sp. M1A.F.Ca.IN.022.05.2.1]RWF83365.1 MAG: DUF563 domain-containing protein [Mesorhizobium